MSKKIVFLTGTRADFGKIKSLIQITQDKKEFDIHIFATGMHMLKLYGKTINEIYKSGFKNIYPYMNQDNLDNNMDRVLAKTIEGFSLYINEIKPDLIVVHGDRVEAMAGAIVGSLNNILVSHIEGGELSGTIDELIRHSVSKLSHIHLVSNNEAKNRLIQLGEIESSIHIIGSPDLDLMNPKTLPSLKEVKKYYNLDFDEYSILMYHPVTTEYEYALKNVKEVVDAVIESNKNYVVIYPNNDLGSYEILNEFKRFEDKDNIRVFPSLRFEYFLTLLYNTEFVLGNSSAGIREAPYYGIPVIDIGTRQSNRSKSKLVVNTDYKKKEILEEIKKISKKRVENSKSSFGNGESDKKFLTLLKSNKIWEVQCQKQFQDIR